MATKKTRSRTKSGPSRNRTRKPPAPPALEFLRLIHEIHAEHGGKALLSLAESLAQSDADPKLVGIIRAVGHAPPLALARWNTLIGEQSVPGVGVPTSPSKDKARSLVSNVTDLIAEWQAHQHKTGDSLNGAMECLIGCVDWDHVEPTAAIGAFRALLQGLPLADLQDLSDSADSEREILAWIVGEASLAQPDDRLPESDAWLLVYTTEACKRHSCFDFIEEVRSMPSAARARIFAVLQALECPEGPGPHPTRGQLQARLVEAVLAGGGSQSLADAYILPHSEWRLRHVHLSIDAQLRQQIPVIRHESKP